MSAANIHFFFTLRDQIHLYHWQTKSFSRHKATDDVVKALLENIDKYVETYMGKYGRPRVSGATSNIHLRNLTEKSAGQFIKSAIEYLLEELPRGLKEGRDSDLLNIRDEMLGSLNQLLYLFSLR
jgi:Family of unknown function (DUF5856)